LIINTLEFSNGNMWQIMKNVDAVIITEEKSHLNSVSIECPHCHATGFQIELNETYPNNWKEYKCKVCNRRFMSK